MVANGESRKCVGVGLDIDMTLELKFDMACRLGEQCFL